MTLPVAPAQISHSDIMAEFGHPANTQWNISADGAPYISFTPSTIIKESDFYGKSATSPAVKIYDYREDPMPASTSSSGTLTGNGGLFESFPDVKLQFTAPGSPARTGDNGWEFTWTGNWRQNPSSASYSDELYTYKVNVGTNGTSPTTTPKGSFPGTPENPGPTNPLSGGLPLPQMNWRYTGPNSARRPSNYDTQLHTLSSYDTSLHTPEQNALLATGISGIIFELDVDFGWSDTRDFGWSTFETIDANPATITGRTQFGMYQNGQVLNRVTIDANSSSGLKMQDRTPATLVTAPAAGTQIILRHYLASIYIY